MCFYHDSDDYDWRASISDETIGPAPADNDIPEHSELGAGDA